MACLFHKWSGCTCEKCGKVRSTGHNYAKTEESAVGRCTVCGVVDSAGIACSVCGVSHARLAADQEAFGKRMSSTGAGIVLGGGPPSMLECGQCGKFSCTSCALDGEEMKRCPACEASFSFSSLV